MSKNFVFSAVVGVASLFLAQGNVIAAPISCTGTVNGISYNLLERVSTASDCYVAEAKNDSVGGSAPFTVNSEKFFDIDQWEFDGRFEDGASEPPSLATFTGSFGSDLYSGTYTLHAGVSAYENIMFVFKSADNVVAYLLQANPGTGTYSTPFTRPPFDLNGRATQQGISHISVYYSGEGRGTPVGEVPEPATAALFGLGVLGMAGLRRKFAAKK